MGFSAHCVKSNSLLPGGGLAKDNRFGLSVQDSFSHPLFEYLHAHNENVSHTNLQIIQLLIAF